MAFVVRKRDEDILEIVDKENGFRAIVKFDGCIHLDKYGVVDWEDEEEEEVLNDERNHSFYVHICDIDQLIDALSEIKKLQQQYFPEIDHQ